MLFIHSFRRSFSQSFMRSFTSFFTQNWKRILTGESVANISLSLFLSVRLSTYLSHSRLSFINLNNVNFLPRLSTVAANPGNLPGTPGKRFPFDSDKHITIVNLCVSLVIYLWSYTLAVVSSYRIMSTHFTVGVSNSCALRQFIIITIVFHIFVRSWIFFYLLGLCNRNKYGMWLSEGSLEKSLRFCFV